MIKMRNPTKEFIERVAFEGDVHLANCKKFFGQVVNKHHPLRYAIKAVVFGALYGKSVKSLAKELELEARNRHRDNILKLEKEVRKLEKELA